MGPIRGITACLLAITCAGCSLLPRELNLAPLWFHRLDEHGEVLEYDFLWPIVHYERTAQGGSDFRIRPLWRRVAEPAVAPPAGDGAPAVEATGQPLATTEHQFLWPLGRVRSDAVETSHRLFPLWSWRARENDDGQRDVDWYLLFPFVWGGAGADGREDYLAVLPFYADIPQFLSYTRFRTVLFPLYVRLDKEGHRHHQVLWPLIGWSACAESGHDWFRVLPFYGHDIEPGRYDRRFALWPFFAWSNENEDFEDPVHSVWIWPFFGWRTGRTVSGWMVLWPFFTFTSKQDHFTTLNVLWPFFRYYWNRVEDHVTSWWFWPFVSHVHSDDQRAWTFLWPLVWWREYHDPGVRLRHLIVLPLLWHLERDEADGSRERFTRLWPLAHRQVRADATGARTSGDFALFSLWPWRGGDADGFRELYGFLWEVLARRQRAPDDRAVDVVGRLYTARERGGESTASVPFLGCYERAADGSRTLRLLNLLPIPLGGGADPAPEASR